LKELPNASIFLAATLLLQGCRAKEKSALRLSKTNGMHCSTFDIGLDRDDGKRHSTLDSVSPNEGVSVRAFADRKFTDQQLYDQIVKIVTELNGVLIDVRRDPRRYTKDMIQVKLF